MSYPYHIVSQTPVGSVSRTIGDFFNQHNIGNTLLPGIRIGDRYINPLTIVLFIGLAIAIYVVVKIAK